MSKISQGCIHANLVFIAVLNSQCDCMAWIFYFLVLAGLFLSETEVLRELEKQMTHLTV